MRAHTVFSCSSFLFFQFIRLSFDTLAENLLSLLQKWKHDKEPLLALFFDNKRNYQKLVNINGVDGINLFFHTRSLWVFTDGLDRNNDVAFTKQIVHHPMHIGILSADLLESTTDGTTTEPAVINQYSLKASYQSKLNPTCDAFLFADKGPLESS